MKCEYIRKIFVLTQDEFKSKLNLPDHCEVMFVEKQEDKSIWINVREENG